MNKTFYIAGSSKNREWISELGDELKVGGWSWEWDWTRVLEEALETTRANGGMVNLAINIARPGLVMHDLRASAVADLFVLHLDPANPSFGGACELGTRLQTGKKAHLILNGSPHHLFFEHPGIQCWPHWHALLEYLGLLHLP